jgi:hypothetical protein
MPIFSNSLRNQWVGTDGKWEAAKVKKMVLERSAEPGAPLQARPRTPRWRSHSARLAAWCRRLQRAPCPRPATNDRNWDLATLDLFTSSPGAKAGSESSEVSMLP